MGNTQTKERDLGLGHPRRFYDGCTAVQVGSYATAEIYFNQAMTCHPGHAFWTNLMEVTMDTGSLPTEQSGRPGDACASSHKNLPSVLNTAEDIGTTVFRDGDHGAKNTHESGVPDNRATPPPPQCDENPLGNDLPSPPSESESVPTLVLPVDQRLVDLQDYVRMLSDVSRIYRLKAATSTGESREMSCRLSMLYNAYTAARLQALLTVLRSHFAARNTEEGGDDADLFQIYAKRAMESQWGSSVFKTELNRKKSSSFHSEARVDSEDRSRKGLADSPDHDEHVCVFWQSLKYFFTVNVVSYVTSALRLVEWDDSPMSPAMRKGVQEMSFWCCELVERDLVEAAEANSHMYTATLMKRFVTLLRECSQEYRPYEESTTDTSEKRGYSRGSQKSTKDLEEKFLRRGPANLAAQQLVFLRTAMRFPVLTLPLFDLTKTAAVALKMEFKRGHRREVKLMTPIERSHEWYASIERRPNFERSEQRSAKPGDSAFLMKKCCVPPGATMRDASFFTCVGLEEGATSLFLLSAITAGVLKSMRKKQRMMELSKATYQLSMDMYGSPTPMSAAVQKLFEQIDDASLF